MGKAAQIVPSGLAAMPAMPWGSHVGGLAGRDDDARDILIPYFRAGIDNREKCLWITGSAVGTDRARQALRKNFAAFDEQEAIGQIEIRDRLAFNGPGVASIPDKIVAGLIEREKKALASGFSGLRIIGDCVWDGRQDWFDLRRYEQLLRSVCRERRMICMCSYHASALEAPQLLDIVAAHDFVLGSSHSNRMSNELLVERHADPRTIAETTPTGANEFQADLDDIAAIGAVPVLLKLICRATSLGFAVVARVTGERWVCLGVHDEIDFGMQPGDELDIKTTFCRDIWRSRQGVIINHVAKDPLYRNHRTPEMYGFQSYISVPILLRNGHFFGTLCAIDPKPNTLDTPDVIGMFQVFADLIAFHIEARRNLDSQDAAHLDARAVAELHEQLVTVLGHDLRNPISAIVASTKFLKPMFLDERSRTLVEIIERSAIRMFGMVDDVADFARARLGGGLEARRSNSGIDAALRHVVDELQILFAEQEILVDLDIRQEIGADNERVARLASNLLINALKYGDPAIPVKLEAATGSDFRLSVSNGGKPIPQDRISGLFDPFVRGDVKPDQRGLGLGLYIVSEIARAHGGSVTVHSDVSETRFTFTMPLR